HSMPLHQSSNNRSNSYTEIGPNRRHPDPVRRSGRCSLTKSQRFSMVRTATDGGGFTTGPIADFRCQFPCRRAAPASGWHRKYMKERVLFAINRFELEILREIPLLGRGFAGLCAL